MTMPDDGLTVTVMMPSRGASEQLGRCLEDLSRQRRAPDQVLVGLDGASQSDADRVAEAYAGLFGDGPENRFGVIPFPKVGLMPIRRALLERAGGEIFVSINDDVRVGPGFIGSHLAVHAEHRGTSSRTIVSGPAAWAPVESPTVFDHAVQGSDLIFFAQRPDADGTLSYRECYGLNFSAPVRAALDAGGFADHTNTYGYEDIDLAYRMQTRCGAVIRFAALAGVVHDHRYGPEDVMRREYELGRAAWQFATSSPDFAGSLFGRDLRDPSELHYWRATLGRSRRDAARVEQTMLRCGGTPADAAPLTPFFLQILAEHWIVLKRFLWGWGLLDRAADRESRWGLLCESGPLP